MDRAGAWDVQEGVDALLAHSRAARLRATREMWSRGDYRHVGDLLASAGREAVASLEVSGCDVLDVACGTGNAALAAVRRGARSVTGVDLAVILLAQAGARARAAGATITLLEGDIEELPLPDAAFDRVVSTFGVMLAMDGPRAARELVRVCRPGGRIAITAWLRTGAFGLMTDVLVDHLPPEPSGLSDLWAWSTLEGLEGLFAGTRTQIALQDRAVGIRAGSAENLVALLEQYSAPLLAVRDALGRRWDRARADIVEAFAALGVPAPGGGIVLDVGYALATVAVPGRA